MADGVIYSIRHVSGVCYVGSTARPVDDRFAEHKRQLKAGRHHAVKLQNMWTVFGAAAFEFIVLETCSLDLLLAREQFWIDSSLALLNVAPVAGSVLGLKKTEQHKAKIGAANKGKRRSAEQKAYIRHCILTSPNRKAVMSEQDKEKRRQACKQAYADPEVRKRVGAGVRAAYAKDPSILKRIAAKLKGRKRPNHSAALKAAHARKKAEGKPWRT